MDIQIWTGKMSDNWMTKNWTTFWGYDRALQKMSDFY